MKKIFYILVCFSVLALCGQGAFAQQSLFGLRLQGDANGNVLTLKAPSSGLSSYTLTFPGSVGAAGSLLYTSNGTGLTNWLAPTANGVLIVSGGVPSWLAPGAEGKVLSISSGVPTWIFAAGTGTVTNVSVASANGFGGSVATSTSTPAITISTSVNGLLKGNGTSVSAASSGIDYSAGTSSLTTGILKSATGTGALSIATASDITTLLGSTTYIQNQTALQASSSFNISDSGSATTFYGHDGTTGSALTVRGGNGSSSLGGALNLYGGNAGTVATLPGAAISLKGGTGSPSGAGGPITITGGLGGASGVAVGGSVTITGGTTQSATTSNGGSVTIQGGTPTSGQGGTLTLSAGNSTAGAGQPASLSAGNAGTTSGGTLTLAGGTGGSLSGSGPGGPVLINGGNATTVNNTGGAVTITAGTGLGTSSGGALTLNGGASAASGTGGAVAINGGAPTTGNTAGGAVTITGGAAIGSGTGGIASFNAGNGTTTGTGGDASVTAGSGGVAAGVATLKGGNATAATKPGGISKILGGTGNTTGAGGSAEVTGGTGGATGSGGDVNIKGGLAGAASGTGGAITFQTAPAAAGTTLSERVRITPNGYVGINTSTPNEALDINGGYATRATDVTLVNGVNDNIAVGNTAYLRIIGPTAAFTVKGLAAGSNGQRLRIVNTTGKDMTVAYKGSSIAANNIETNTGGDVIVKGTAPVLDMIYDSTLSEWLLGTLNANQVVGGVGSLIYAYKGSASSVDSLGAYSDPDLKFSVNANETWEINGELDFKGVVNNNNAKITFTIPSGATMKVMYTGIQDANGQGIAGNDQLTTTSGALSSAITVDGNKSTLVGMRGIIRTGNSAGTIQFQWASATNNKAVTLASDSYMKIQRIK